MKLYKDATPEERECAETFLQSVCTHSMRALAEIIVRNEGEVIRDEAMLNRALELLKLEIQGGYIGLVAEMKEANEAFHGNNKMLAIIMAAGCTQFAANAWKKANGGAQ